MLKGAVGDKPEEPELIACRFQASTIFVKQRKCSGSRILLFARNGNHNGFNLLLQEMQSPDYTLVVLCFQTG